MRRERRRRRATRRARRGAAMIETALVLPFLLTLFLGIVEFGQVIFVQHLLVTSARDAARSASVPGSTNEGVVTSVKEFLDENANIDEAKVTVTITIEEAPGNEDAHDDLESAHKRDRISARVQVTFSEVSWITPFFVTQDTALSGHCMIGRE